MTSIRRPDDEILLRYAAGRLDAGFALLVETHLTMRPRSREIVAWYEAIGGALLDEIEPAPSAPDALEAALAALDCEPSVRAAETRPPTRPDFPQGFILPSTLESRAMGQWRWIAPGLRSSPIALRGASESRAFLLEIAPGTRIPRHGHEGVEMTCVLRGSFSDGTTHFVEGDVAQADAGVEHDIFVDSEIACICLVAIEGRTRPRNWFGRLYQRLVDI
jgi:putative transcriptional regulator